MGEKERLARVAQTYRSEGYDVLVRPSEEQRPPFLARHVVDVLATKGDEKAVVAVRRNRAALRGDTALLELGAAVEREPGWRLDLVVAEPMTEPMLTVDAAEPSTEAIHAWLSQAEQQGQKGELALACFLACSALEATLRRLGRDLGLSEEHLDSASVLETLTFEGIVEREEYRPLSDAIMIRDTLASGRTTQMLTAEVPRAVVAVTRRLLAEGIMNGTTVPVGPTLPAEVAPVP